MKNPILLLPVWFDRSLAIGNLSKLFVTTIFILAIPVLFFNCYNFVGYLFSREMPINDVSLLMNLYESYLNPNFGDNCSSPERGIRLFMAYLGAFLLTGLLISLFVAYLQSRRERWERGYLHYPAIMRFGHFSIVIGGNEMVPNLVSQLLNNNTSDYIVVMTNRDIPTLRKEFVSSLGKKEKRIIIYYGERTSKDDLERLRFQYARKIYVIGEQLDINQNGSHHDVKNMDCVQKIAGLLKKIGFPNQIPCHVMFEYQSTFSVFQFAEVTDDISDVLDFWPFNYYETWAQKVLVNRELFPTNKSEYLPLEGTKAITKEDDDTVHLIVVGMSRMGIALAVEAAHIAHYPNFISKNKRTRITFIDSEARKEMNYFQGHYKELFGVSKWRYMKARPSDLYYEGTVLFDHNTWHDPISDMESQSQYKPQRKGSMIYSLGNNYIDVEWQFIEGNLEMPTVQRYISDEAKRKECRLTIAICFPKDNVSLAASLYLPDAVYEENSNVQQVLVYQPYGDAMRKSFKNDATESHKSYKLFARLRAFGMMNLCYDVEVQASIETMLKEAENAYNAEAKKQIPGRNVIRQRFGLPEAFKGKPAVAKQWSNYYSVSHMWTKLRSVNYNEIAERLKKEDVSLLAQVEHIRWNLEQLLMGYAPLNAEKFCDLKMKFEKGQKIKRPSDKLSEIQNDEREKLSAEVYPEVVKWLNEWKDFDDAKEQLKANMEHANICSYDVLESIDKDSMSYDVVLVRALPRIYRNLKNMQSKGME